MPQSEPIIYPNRSAEPGTVFTQETLDRLTAKVLSWRQAPGVLGGLHLHSCWGEASVLTRRYHGQTVAHEASVACVAMKLFDRTGDSFWRELAGHILSNVLFLQAPQGGFIHASSEFEPTYTCYDTCPIAQGRPINALLEYAAWKHADPQLRQAIEPAVRRFWTYMQDYWWRRGNAFIRPLDRDGWCGVTNQDFVIVEAMARFGKVYADWSQYERYAKPAFDDYLSPRMYHEAIGLFERGDRANFAERTSYYNVILPCLHSIYELTGDSRIPAVIGNVSAHLFDAFFVDRAGDGHMAWGADTDPQDKSRVAGWNTFPIVLPAYPEQVEHMRRYLSAHPDAEMSRKADMLERTLASRVFSDGTLPTALGGADPLFEIVPGSGFDFWAFLVDRLGAGVRSPLGARVVSVSRSRGGLVYRSNDLLWSIERDGQRLFAGLRTEPGGIVAGDEKLQSIDFGMLEKADVVERVDMTPIAAAGK